jgi:hypothetical protein
VGMGSGVAASHQWLKGVGELQGLRELHLDMPLTVPGQVRRGLGRGLGQGLGNMCPGRQAAWAWLQTISG